MYFLYAKLFIWGMSVLLMVLAYQKHKTIGKISQKSREYFIMKHCDDESPYGLWKMDIYKDDEKFRKYNDIRFWMEEALYIIVMIVVLFL